MKTLLQLNSSLNSDNGQSSILANKVVEEWLSQNPDGQVIKRDLAANPLPHLTAERFQAFGAPAEKRNDAQKAHVAVSDELINELRQADVVVIGLPMYNFGIPSTFKAWIDHIARAGQTFNYTAKGPVGLLDDRKVIVCAARGGLYLNTPNDTQTPYIKTVLNFIGISDIEFVFAEGLATGEEPRAKSLANANEHISGLFR